MFGHQGIKHADPRWYAATLMNYVLGGSDFSSRLMIEVRAKRGLTYGIGSSFGASLYQGAFRVAGSTKNETTWEALLASVNEIRRMKADGPTAGGAGQGQGLLRRQLPVQAADAPPASRQRWSPPSCTASAPPTCASCRVRLAAVDAAAAKARGGASCSTPTRCWS